MKMHKTSSLAVVALLSFMCPVASAQTVRIGTASGVRGQTVSVPVTLTATTSHTAALVRVQYNAAVLESPSLTAGALLSKSHMPDSYAAAAGRFNVAAYASSGMPSFKAKSGTLFTLIFRIKTTAPIGPSPIIFTAVGAPGLPSSDLVGVAGNVVSPSAIAGSVTVGATAAQDSWLLYP